MPGVGSDEDKNSSDAGITGPSVPSRRISESIFRYFDSVREEFLALPEVHEEVLDEIVDGRISMLRSLSRIKKETFDRVAPVVAENTRYLYSGVWDESWAKTLRTKPNLENFLGAIYVIVIPLIAIFIAFSGDHVQIGGTATVLISLLSLVICGLLTWALARLLKFVSRQRGAAFRDALIAAGLVWLTILVVKMAMKSLLCPILT